MTEMPNPSEEEFRTAHKQNKDGSYADVVMPVDVSHFVEQKPIKSKVISSIGNERKLNGTFNN